MNISCPICSELLKETADIVTTSCGHVFHRGCLESWLNGQKTCPTCRRENTTPRSLIKLFFEFDDNKANLNLEEILKNNDELTSKQKIQEQRALSLELKNRELTIAQKNDEMKMKALERQKQLDDMAIAGFKSIKDDSANEIVRLNEIVRILKLDLLAEKQLRRMHQSTLHDFDPYNVNYNIETINIDLPKADADQNSCSSSSQAVTSGILKAPLLNLNCEAKASTPMEVETKTPSTSYVVPIKIQKATKDSPRLSFFTPKRFSAKISAESPKVGFQFVDTKASNVTPEQSTSLAQSGINLNTSAQSSVYTTTPTTPKFVSESQFRFGSESGSSSSSFKFTKPSFNATTPNFQCTVPTTRTLAFTLPATTENQPSTSQSSLIGSNQKRLFGEESKFRGFTPEASANNRKTFDFANILPTFQPSTSTLLPLSSSQPTSTPPLLTQASSSNNSVWGHRNVFETSPLFEANNENSSLVNSPKASDR